MVEIALWRRARCTFSTDISIRFVAFYFVDDYCCVACCKNFVSTSGCREYQRSLSSWNVNSGDIRTLNDLVTFFMSIILSIISCTNYVLMTGHGFWYAWRKHLSEVESRW